MRTLILILLLQATSTKPNSDHILFPSLSGMTHDIGLYHARYRYDYLQKGDDSILFKIEDEILKLPEVQRKQTLIDSVSHHKHGISMMVLKKPGKTRKYYWIAVGYNSEIRFETMFNFYVWPTPIIIKYLDTGNGKVITLAQWRKSTDYFD